MPTLIMTKGLPASGKTTWAKKCLAESDRVKRVNKDDLRAMIDGSKWSKENEKNILAVRDMIVAHYLRSGFDVIVDDTNLAPKHEEELRKIVENMGGEFEIKDFTDVSLSTCLKRDSERANSVGEKVIKSMYNSFLKQKTNVAQYQAPPYNPDLPDCIIVDIDGTLAHMKDRSPYDYSKVETDVVDVTIAGIVQKYYKRDIQDLPDLYVLIVSGREDGCRPHTERWLENNSIPYDELYMRKHGDHRDDRIVKKEIYEEWIKPRFNVRFVLDDRDRVVKMWREEGLKVLQVAEGDF